MLFLEYKTRFKRLSTKKLTNLFQLFLITAVARQSDTYKLVLKATKTTKKTVNKVADIAHVYERWG